MPESSSFSLKILTTKPQRDGLCTYGAITSLGQRSLDKRVPCGLLNSFLFVGRVNECQSAIEKSQIESAQKYDFDFVIDRVPGLY
jgi:hypothetical protein